MELEKIISRETSDGWTDAQATDSAVEAMKKYANKDCNNEHVVNLAHEITDQVIDSKSKMLAIRNWILANLTYVKDEVEAKDLYDVQHPEGVELVKSPLAVLESGKYDCDCGSTLIASMLMAIGIKPRFVVVGFYPTNVSGPDSYEHVFTEGWDPDSGSWVAIDPVSFPQERKMLEDSKQYKIYEIC